MAFWGRGALLPASAQGLELKQSAISQIDALMNEKRARTPAQRKINSKLLRAIKHQRGERAPKALRQLRSMVQTDAAGKILVDIKAEVTDALLVHIEELGGQIVNQFPRYRAIRARIPLNRVETLAGHHGVGRIRPAARAILNKIDTSEGDVAHAANDARGSYGVDGSGVKIGVLSDSVDSLNTLQKSGDLPLVTVLAGQSGIPGTSEGTAMLEIIYDLAPGAQLFFATAFNSAESFAQNIRDLRFIHGCDIIVDDVAYLGEAPFQDDLIAEAVNDVTADGALYFSAAGNSGNLTHGTSGVWEGDYSPVALPAKLAAAGESAHNFNGKNYNAITKDSPYEFELFWSDPLVGPCNDYDLYLLDSTLANVWDISDDEQSCASDQAPFEYVDSEGIDDTGNVLVAVKFLGEIRHLHLNAILGELAVATSGQILGHATAEDAFAVAAVDVAKANGGRFTGGAANPVEDFSSDGPRRMFFDEQGTPYTPNNFLSSGGIVRQKPDIAAADGVSTATPGFKPFHGTSASAPHAAAMAALLLEKEGALSVSEAQVHFFASAMDIESSGVDRDSGYGLVRADILLSCEPSFADVPCSYWAFEDIGKLVGAGITGGCAKDPARYCPGAVVSRDQMAVFIERGLGTFSPPPATGAMFVDVPKDYWAASHIEQFSKDGITKGCGVNPSRYCPTAPVTRAQMAVFLLRAKHGSSYKPPAAKGTVFSDVPKSYWAVAWIEQLAEEGITGGCSATPKNYCPSAGVNRDQMAAFLVRVFGL